MCSEKVAVVTGANKGLGLALVEDLCLNKYGIIYLTSRNETLGLEAQSELRKKGLDGLDPRFHQLDITCERSIKTFYEHIKTNYETISLLINNAGILFLKDSKETLLDQATITLNVNFFSTVNFTEAIIPLLNEGSKIINISSSSGHLSRIPCEKLRNKLKNPKLSLEDLKSLMYGYIECVKMGSIDQWGDSAYVVSKVGVNAYTFLLHRKLSTKGISVNCVHPGYVQSDMTRGAGSITPREGAQTPLKLALDDCGSGHYVWHDGTTVAWDGPDPRGYIDGRI